VVVSAIKRWPSDCIGGVLGDFGWLYLLDGENLLLRALARLLDGSQFEGSLRLLIFNRCTRSNQGCLCL
jgi:hypothetical protein